MLRLILIFIGSHFFQSAFTQNTLQTIEYTTLVKYKVDENRFEFGWLSNVFSGIPCFRDYTKSKIQTQLVDPSKDSIIYTSKEPKINGLKIIPSKILVNKKNGRFQISGKITGAWESVIPSEFEIYIGHKKDTILNITIAPNLHGTVYYNGSKVDSEIVVGRVPAFYMTNLQKFNAYRGTKKLPKSDYKEILFDITAKIDEKSILVFGLSSRYAEIFEIGKLLGK